MNRAHLLTGGKLRAARVIAVLLLLVLTIQNAVPRIQARVDPGDGAGSAALPAQQPQALPAAPVAPAEPASSAGTLPAMSARPDAGYVLLGSPAISASKDDALAIDYDADGRADP